MIKTVVVCEAQVPFIRGGAEALVSELVLQFRKHGFDTERVSLPFKWYPKSEVLAHAGAWRLLDLSESNGRPIDLLVGTKFPTYFARHPRKVTWLVHQHRAAYELVGTPYSDFAPRRTRHRVARSADRARHRDARRVPRPLQHFGDDLEPPAALQRPDGRRRSTIRRGWPTRLRGGPAGNYVLSRRTAGNGQARRPRDPRDAAHRAVALADQSRAPARQREAFEAARGVARAGRRGCSSSEKSTDEQVDRVSTRARSRWCFPPFDEDYGYVTLEAFLSHKPVVTTTDAGGPERVRHGRRQRARDRPRSAAIGEASPRSIATDVAPHGWAMPDTIWRAGSPGPA